jgi:class 3 adenylate cyclase
MPSSDKPTRKLAAIMFTDIAGFTELSARDEEGAFALIEKQRKILKPIVSEFGGEWLKEMGDGLLLSFLSSKQAVNCAIKIQHTVKKIDELNLRIGIHQGDILEKAGDVFGDDVNVASRIEPFAAVGGVAISHKIQSDISSSPEFETKFISQPSLKGVRQEVKVYCITSHNLPETEITKVTAKLEKDVKKLWFNQKTIIKIVFFLSVLVFGIIWWVSDKKEESQSNVENTNQKNKIQHPNLSFGDTVFVNEIITDIGTFHRLKELWSVMADFDTLKIYLPIPDSILSVINRDIVSTIISVFPYNYVATFKDLEKSYVEKAKFLSLKDRVDDYKWDKNFSFDVGIGIYVYHIETYKSEYYHNKDLNRRKVREISETHYALIVETSGIIGNVIRSFVVKEKEEIPEKIEQLIESHIKAIAKHENRGNVLAVQDNRLIAKIDGSYPVRNGTEMDVFRHYYNGFRNISDEGVQRRINDLEEIRDCFPSLKAWQDSIKEVQYFWSHKEYDDLVNRKSIRFGADGLVVLTGFLVRISEVFDTTASAIIYNQEYPCVEIKKGDILRMAF